MNIIIYDQLNQATQKTEPFYSISNSVVYDTDYGCHWCGIDNHNCNDANVGEMFLQNHRSHVLLWSNVS